MTNFKFFLRAKLKYLILFFFANSLTRKYLENKTFLFQTSTFLLSIIVENLNSNPKLIKKYRSKYGNNFQKVFWNSRIGQKWHNDFKSSKLIDEYFDLISNIFEQKNFKSVLDIGCGQGTLTFKLSEKFKKAVFHGIDISENAIYKANQSFKNENLRFSINSFFKINRHFDFILSTSAVDYISESEIKKFIIKILHTSNECVIVSSLRGVNFSDFLNLDETITISRYDIGYVHPINNLLQLLNESISFSFNISTCGHDSVFIHLKRKNK